jgi:Domain of unknown function (DUF3846)
MILDTKVDGYYVVHPHHHSTSDVIFVPRQSETPLDVLQKLVDGYIEVVYIDGGKGQCIVNEESKVKGGYLLNPFATLVYNNPYDVIVGTMVVLCGKARLT